MIKTLIRTFKSSLFSKFLRISKTNKLIIGTNNQNNRELWLEAAINSIPANSRILDAGAGELQYKKFCSHLEYVSQDFGDYDGLGNNSGLQMSNWDNSKIDIRSDITSIPQQEASFDAIMCIEVFEHLPDPISAIKEFSRLLRKSGTMIITAPFCSLTHFAPFHFYTGFNKYFYEKHLAENGFEIIEISPNGDYFDYLAQELRRVSSVAQKYGNNSDMKVKKHVRKLLPLLQQMSDKGHESSELLCFGYHVLAKKI